MFVYRNQNAGQSHSIKINNSSFERVEEFKFVGTTLTNQNSIQEENQSTLQSANACCHSVKYPLPSSLLFKPKKIKILRTVILSIVLYGYENWSLTLKEEHMLSVFQMFFHKVERKKKVSTSENPQSSTSSGPDVI